MFDLIKKTILTGVGLAAMTKDKIEELSRELSEKGELSGKIIDGLKLPFRHLATLFRSSLIGLGIGVIPGEGSAVANFTAYLTEARVSKRGDKFGTGMPEGVIAPDNPASAPYSNATIQGCPHAPPRICSSDHAKKSQSVSVIGK